MYANKSFETTRYSLLDQRRQFMQRQRRYNDRMCLSCLYRALILILLVTLPVGHLYANEFDEITDIALSRRSLPINIPTLTTVFTQEIFRYDDDYFLYTATPKDPLKHDYNFPIRILAHLCKKDGKPYYADGVFLRNAESAEQFYFENLKVAIEPGNFTDMLNCVVGSWQNEINNLVYTNHKGERIEIWTNQERVLELMSVFAQIFARKEQNETRAVEFMVYVFNKKYEELKSLEKTENISDLNNSLVYFDNKSPTSLLDIQLTYTMDQLRDVVQYLNFSIKMRRKVLPFYPEHNNRLEKEILYYDFFSKHLK